MEYYSHTYKLHYRKHRKFAVDIVSEEQLQEDLIRQQRIVDCSYVAYPYGHYNEKMAAILKEHGMKIARPSVSMTFIGFRGFQSMPIPRLIQ